MKIRFDLSENNVFVVGTLTIILLILKLIIGFKWWYVAIPIGVDLAIFTYMFVIAYFGVVLKKIAILVTKISDRIRR